MVNRVMKFMRRLSESGGMVGARPTRAYEDDAGFDLFTSEDTIIPPHGFVDVPCGVRVELPGGTWGFLTGRSSTLRKRGLLVHTGIIDQGYRGELFAGVWNLTDEPVTVCVGERISQLIVMENTSAQVILREVTKEVDFSSHPRGTAGFGSSGR